MDRVLPGEENQNCEWRTREEAETSWEYGERPEERSVEQVLENGFALIDKPAGPTSHQVSVWVKESLHRDKTGHAGTLDPKVTGVLPVAFNDATKVFSCLSQAGKEYVGVMQVEDAVQRETVEQEAGNWIGSVTQLPPKQSAVKREERDRTIYYLEILEVDDTNVLFRIGCESGFYVRTFCKDFADALGTTGEMTDLRRTRVGVFPEEDAVYLQDVVDEYQFWKQGEPHRLDELLYPVEAGVRHLKKMVVKDSAVAAVAHGAPLGVTGVSMLQEGIAPGDTVAVLTLKGELIALATAEQSTASILGDDAGDAADPSRVFMDRGLYPKEW